MLKDTLQTKNAPESFVMSITFKVLDFTLYCNMLNKDKNHEFLHFFFSNTRKIIEREY